MKVVLNESVISEYLDDVKVTLDNTRFFKPSNKAKYSIKGGFEFDESIPAVEYDEKNVYVHVGLDSTGMALATVALLPSISPVVFQARVKLGRNFENLMSDLQNLVQSNVPIGEVSKIFDAYDFKKVK